MSVIGRDERCTCEYLIDLEDGTGPHHRPGCPALGETEVERLTRQLQGAVRERDIYREALNDLRGTPYDRAKQRAIIDAALSPYWGQ